MTLEIHEALVALGEVYPLHEMDDLNEFFRSIEPLTHAVKRGEWDLIATAAQMHAKAPSAEMYVDIFVRHMACDIYFHPQKYGLVAKASKQDILDVLRTQFPLFFVRLPTSKRGLTDWWKKVGCGAKQSRGYAQRAPKNS